MNSPALPPPDAGAETGHADRDAAGREPPPATHGTVKPAGEALTIVLAPSPMRTADMERAAVVAHLMLLAGRMKTPEARASYTATARRIAGGVHTNVTPEGNDADAHAEQETAQPD